MRKIDLILKFLRNNKSKPYPMDFITKKFDTSHHSVLSFIEKNGENLKDIKMICRHQSTSISNPEWSVMAIDLKKMLSNFKEFNGYKFSGGKVGGYRKA